MARSTLSFPEADRGFLEHYLPKTNRQHDEASLPFVTLTFATSMDAALSLSPGTQTALSGLQSKAMTHYLRSRHDAILIGVGTAVADNPSLNCRLEGVGGYGGQGLEGQPRPVVIDPLGRWKMTDETKILNLSRQGMGRGPWVVSTAEMGKESKDLLESAGGESLALEMDTSLDPPRLAWASIFRCLYLKGIRSVMVEGGANVINALLAEDNASLVDVVIVTIAPTWLGKGGVVVSPERTAGPMHNVASLRSVRWQQLGDDAVVCGHLYEP